MNDFVKSMNDIIPDILPYFRSTLREDDSTEVSPSLCSAIVIFAGISFALAFLKKNKKEEHVNGTDE